MRYQDLIDKAEEMALSRLRERVAEAVRDPIQRALSFEGKELSREAEILLHYIKRMKENLEREGVEL